MRRDVRYLLFPAILLAAFLTASDANATDVKYFILCDCDPDHQADADLEIQAQLAELSVYGGQGFEAGDEVIIQDQVSGTIGKWKLAAGGTWDESPGTSVTCGLFEDCVDGTPGCVLADTNDDWICPNEDNPNVSCDASLISGNSNFLVSWGPGDPAGLIDYYKVKKFSAFYMNSWGYGGQCISWNQCNTEWTVQAFGPGGASGICFMETVCGGGGGVPRSVVTMASPVDVQSRPLADVLLGGI